MIYGGRKLKKIIKIFVVGSGFMGSGIAQNAVMTGFDVTLHDISMDVLNRAKTQIVSMLGKSVSKGKITQEQKNRAIDALHITENLKDAIDADLVIEAIVEQIDAKKDLFLRLSNICNEDTIFASNTSSMSIAELSSVCKNPSRFIGMHFFSPVPLMKLLEIVKGIATDDETVEVARYVGERLGKYCIISKDHPAFIVNRMLNPMLNEAIQILESGTGSIVDIDNGMKYGLNHPMGPFEIVDMGGIETLLAIMETIYKETGDPKYRPARLLRDMVRMGWYGRKTGIGFYIYNEDGTKIPNPKVNSIIKL